MTLSVNVVGIQRQSMSSWSSDFRPLLVFILADSICTGPKQISVEQLKNHNVKRTKKTSNKYLDCQQVTSVTVLTDYAKKSTQPF